MKNIKVAAAFVLLMPMISIGQTVSVTPGSAAAYIFSPATASGTTCPVCSSSQGTWKLNLADASIDNPGPFTRANIRAVRWTGWGNFVPTTAGSTSGKFTGIILREPCEPKGPPTTGGPVSYVENCTYSGGDTKTGFVKCPEGITFSSGGKGSGYCAYAYGVEYTWWWLKYEYAYAVQVEGISVDNVIDSP